MLPLLIPMFGTFGRYVTNLRGTFAENVKKSQKSTHPTSLKMAWMLLIYTEYSTLSI
jgi:hypothetical protein